MSHLPCVSVSQRHVSFPFSPVTSYLSVSVQPPLLLFPATYAYSTFGTVFLTTIVTWDSHPWSTTKSRLFDLRDISRVCSLPPPRHVRPSSGGNSQVWCLANALCLDWPCLLVRHPCELVSPSPSLVLPYLVDKTISLSTRIPNYDSMSSCDTVPHLLRPDPRVRKRV